ncbi:MAG TPA: LytTR family DNA-binding domain-containing protein, partial [Rhizomicrobium sp.]
RAAGIDRRPLAQALQDQFVVDGLLLFFAVAVLSAIAHGFFFFRRAQAALDAPPQAATGYLASVPVKTRGKTIVLDLGAVDWIETQGNYLALHAAGTAQLIRETSIAFEARIDPARFARIHRQTIVALDRIAQIAPLPSGDATLTLKDGTALRMSRGYRDGVRAKFERRTPAV